MNKNTSKQIKLTFSIFKRPQPCAQGSTCGRNIAEFSNARFTEYGEYGSSRSFKPDINAAGIKKNLSYFIAYFYLLY